MNISDATEEHSLQQTLMHMRVDQPPVLDDEQLTAVHDGMKAFDRIVSMRAKMLLARSAATNAETVERNGQPLWPRVSEEHERLALATAAQEQMDILRAGWLMTQTHFLIDLGNAFEQGATEADLDVQELLDAEDAGNQSDEYQSIHAVLRAMLYYCNRRHELPALPVPPPVHVGDGVDFMPTSSSGPEAPTDAA